MPDYSTYDSVRRAPSNIDAEQALLGALLANNRSAYDRVSDFLLPEHFADPIHGRIYKAIAARSEKGLVADAVTLRAEFENSGELDDVGGTAYLAQLLTAMVGIINAGDYGKAVYDAWLRRRLIEVGTNIANDAQGSDIQLDAGKQLERAEQAILTLATGNSSDFAPVRLGDAIQMAIDEGEAERQLQKDIAAGNPTARKIASTGIPSLDRRILKLRPEQLYVAAGRPGMGKTTLAQSIAVNVGCGIGATEDGEIVDDQSLGLPVLYFVCDESVPDMGAHAAAQLTSVPMDRILNGTLSVKEAELVLGAKRRVDQAPIFVLTRPKQSFRWIASQARRLRRKYPTIGLIVIDFLQRMADPPNAKDKRLAVGQNVSDIKDLAKELKCPILLLSQLSRKVEERSDKRPALSDLKETGEIEENADVAMLIYREEYYLRLAADQGGDSGDSLPSAHDADLARAANKMEVICAKVRRGPTGIEWLFFDGAASRVGEGRF